MQFRIDAGLAQLREDIAGRDNDNRPQFHSWPKTSVPSHCLQHGMHRQSPLNGTRERLTSRKPAMAGL